MCNISSAIIILYVISILTYCPHCQAQSVKDDDDADQKLRQAENDAERLRQQNEARRRRKQRERERLGGVSARNMMEAGADENCDWRVQPLTYMKGGVCGAHYKVLGLDRKKGSLPDKTEIKKAYRKKSLEVHPDKNPSPEASAAFKVVQDAYECLSDDKKRNEYEIKLVIEEERITMQRNIMKDWILEKTLEALYNINYYATLAAKNVYQSAISVWDIFGEVEMTIFDARRPVGQYLLLFLLVMKGQIFLKIFGTSYCILRINHELAKSGFFE